MPDEHESAVAAWLADPTTQREIAILKKQFAAWRESDVYLFAVMMEILTGMDFYGTPPVTDVGNVGGSGSTEDEPPEPWQDGDATGWKP